VAAHHYVYCTERGFWYKPDLNNYGIGNGYLRKVLFKANPKVKSTLESYLCGEEVKEVQLVDVGATQ